MNTGVFSIKDFVSSGKQSLALRNYWSAFTVALALPSMCSRIAFKGEEYKGKRKDKNKYWEEEQAGRKWHDKKCYIDFCNKHLFQYDIDLKNCTGFAETLYDLRCGIVHEAACDKEVTFIIDGTAYTRKIIFTTGEPLSFQLFQLELNKSEYTILNISTLCNRLFSCVEKWCKDENGGAYKLKGTFYINI